MKPEGLRPAAVLAESKLHGVRVRYMAGCRCTACRAANTRYESDRAAARKAGDWNGLVSADAARMHLLALSKKGVGRRAVSASTDVAQSVLADIRSGKRKQIRKRTETKILAVTKDCASDHAVVQARKTWHRISQLLEEGYTKGQIAQRLGAKRPALQLGKKYVLAETALKVEQLFQSTLI